MRAPRRDGESGRPPGRLRSHAAATASRFALLGAVAAGAAGCLFGGGSQEQCDPDDMYEGQNPGLLIDLLWDELPDTTLYSGATCDVAVVDQMRWQIVDDDGATWADYAGDCQNTINVCADLPAGSYTLQVEGLDDAGEVRWETRCTDLLLVRFDTLYRCDIVSK